MVYRTGELAHAAAHEYEERSVELDGHQLKIYKYRVPIESRPACMSVNCCCHVVSQRGEGSSVPTVIL